MTIDELRSAAAVVRDATEEGENTATRIGQLFLDTVNTLCNVSTNAIKGYVVISSTSDLPTSPTTEQQMKGYLLGTVLYVWVGTGGDTLGGKYQSAQLKGADGAPGEKGDKGESGVHLGDVKLVNNLTEGGEVSALTAEMGKLLYNNFIALFNALGEGAFWSGKPTLNWNVTYAYISSGLVFHLDSLDMGGTSGHWIDSVGGIDFELTDCDTSGKGVKFNGSTSIGKSSASWQYMVSECTIEVCIKIGSRTDWCTVLISNTQGSISFAYSTANSYYINGAGANFPSSAKPMRSDTIQSVSMSKENCMANGSAIPANAEYYCILSSALSIGGRDGNDMFDGTIYDIRVYNRVLSDAERVNNLKVDKYRFNF